MDSDQISWSKSRIPKWRFKNILPVPFLTGFLVSLIFLITVAGSIYFLKAQNQESVISQTNSNKLENSITDAKNLPPKEIIGFLPAWVITKDYEVDLKNLTHIIYFGLNVNENGDIIKVSNDNLPTTEWSYLNSPYVKNLRQQAKKNGVKFSVSFKNFDNTSIDNLISNQFLTDKFILQVTEIIDKHQLDGVNIDFEYFTDTDFPTNKFLNRFLSSLRTQLKKEYSNLIISIDVNALAITEDRAYDMVKIAEEVDKIILMGYDFSRPDSKVASPVAPLYSEKQNHSIDKSIQTLAGRVLLEEIILAIPFYGYEWQTISNKFNSNTIEHTGSFASIERINELISSRNDVKLNFDQETQTPWLSYIQSGAIKQIYYEDSRSIAKKVGYIKEKGLGGIGIWALGYEGDKNEAIWSEIAKIKN